MHRVTSDTLAYYQFETFVSYSGLVHGLFTRLGGQSRPPWASLNVGHTVGDDPEAVDANHHLICQALGLGMGDLVSPHQVHSATVGVVDEQDRGCVREETDALITAVPGVPLLLRFADCVPLLIYDPVREVIGLAHAGWRGTLAGMARETVRAMSSAFGCYAPDLVAGIGPAIGPCCYQVGADVALAVEHTFGRHSGLLSRQNEGRWHLDLWRANQLQLAEAGVGEIEVSGICTACHTDEWFSHRAEGGRTGRWGALISLGG
jgi:YfiH family protein